MWKSRICRKNCRIELSLYWASMLEAFIAGRQRIIVATSSLGMGVDVPDIWCIIHIDWPFCVLDYDALQAYLYYLYHLYHLLLTSLPASNATSLLSWSRARALTDCLSARNIPARLVCDVPGRLLASSLPACSRSACLPACAHPSQHSSDDNACSQLLLQCAYVHYAILKLAIQSTDSKSGATPLG
jgi:hypothetical protein